MDRADQEPEVGYTTTTLSGYTTKIIVPEVIQVVTPQEQPEKKPDLTDTAWNWTDGSGPCCVDRARRGWCSCHETT